MKRLMLRIVLLGGFIGGMFLISNQVVLNFNKVQDKISNCSKSVHYLLGYLRFVESLTVKNAEDILKKQEQQGRIINNLLNIVKHQQEQLSEIKEDYFDFTLINSNAYIVNKTKGSLGSGVFIKWNDKVYILTARHLIEEETDDLELWLSKDKKYKLNIVKVSQNYDLMLLKCDKYTPTRIAELSNDEPYVGSRIYMVGNPGGLNTIVTTGIVSKRKDNIYLCSIHSFFGNSGGAVYYKNKVIGITSFCIPLSKVGVDVLNGITVVTEHFTGIVDIFAIKSFLKKLDKKNE